MAEKNIEKKKEENMNETYCVLCKEKDNQKDLHFLCKVKFTNVLNTIILKGTRAFLIFSTCGHQVHPKCFSNQQFQNKCPECSKYTNILISSSS